MIKLLERTKESILDTLFPALCVSCKREGRYVCSRCEIFLGEAQGICSECFAPDLEGETHEYCKKEDSLEGLVTIWEYEGAVKRLLSAIKNQGVTHALQETGRRILALMLSDQSRFQHFLSFLLLENTVLTFVPMERKQEKQRGFNHAKLLAQELGTLTGKPVVPLLLKKEETLLQSMLGVPERLFNVRDSFEATETEQKRVVLVDDTWGTGSTMKECCKALKRKGVEEVWGFVIAKELL